MLLPFLLVFFSFHSSHPTARNPQLEGGMAMFHRKNGCAWHKAGNLRWTRQRHLSDPKEDAKKNGDVPFRARTWAVTPSPAFFCWPSYHAITWITTVKGTPGSEHTIVARISESWFRLKALQTSVVSSPATHFWREPHELLGFVEISSEFGIWYLMWWGLKVLTIGI